MIKKSKYFLFLFTLVTFFGLTTSVKASNYVIDKYDVNIEVTKDNYYLVTEEIETDFLYESHGIYRYIPFRFPDRENLYSRIDNLKVQNDKYEKSYRDEYGYRFLMIKIGDADKTIVGPKKYTISYDYKVGKFSGEQFIGYNLMGNMSTQIQEGSFKIILPNKIDPSEIKFYQGEMGSAFEPDINYKYVEDSSGYYITGKTNSPIGSTEFLTLYIPVDDSYFASAPVLKSYYQSAFPWLIVCSFILISVSLTLWYRFGRDKKVVNVVEFYPPEDLTPIEISGIYNEKNHNTASIQQIKECTSLFYYLANKGYVKIHFLNNKDFEIEKTDKEIINEKKHIKVFYEQLFLGRNNVKSADLEDDFYETASATLLSVNKYDMFDNKTLAFRVLAVILGIMPFALTIMTLFDHFQIVKTIGVVIVSVVATIYNLAISYNLEKSVSGIGRGKVLLILALMIGMSLLTYLLFLITGLLTLIIIFLLIQMSMTIALFIKKRKDSAITLLGRINGFKEFLEIARKNELEKLIEENPYYFYDILPYAHVLGVSKVFAEKFADIKMQVPGYYQADGTIVNYWMLYYNIALFNHIANASYSHYQQINSKNFSGSGGFSGGGGGFSGGGFGGGGGGSW